jgi:hypothetical protein
MSSTNQLILKQGKPFAFTFELLDDDGATALELPSNCGFRMQFRGSYADSAALLSISSVGDEPAAQRVGQAFEIAVPSSRTAAIDGPTSPAPLVSDIEIFDLDTSECVVDGGTYTVQWVPEVTK